MEKLLRPERLDIDPNLSSASKQWKHWLRSFNNFVSECGENAPDKLRCLENFSSATVYEYIEGCTAYDEAIEILNHIYIKPPNEVFARHLLATRRQLPEESLDNFLQALRTLSKDCNFRAVTAEVYREELIRDAYISGITSSLIRQRLLENPTLSLQAAHQQSKSLDLAHKNSEMYEMPQFAAANVTKNESEPSTLAAIQPGNKSKRCYFCGFPFHNREECPARDANCNTCGKKGHFSKVCMSKRNNKEGKHVTASLFSPILCAIGAPVPQSLLFAAAEVIIREQTLSALIDSASSDSYISADAAKKLSLPLQVNSRDIYMAQTDLNVRMLGSCNVDLKLKGVTYPTITLGIINNLCSDVILGQDFQKLHKRITFEYGGGLPELIIANKRSHCAVAAATVDNILLFPNLPSICKPIATKSRRFNKFDNEFIATEINRLLSEGIIEQSMSPWRAQVVVVKDKINGKRKRLCVDYSQTINLFTELDAYPLPRIDDIINKLSSSKYFSTFDLKSAYHQLPISDVEKKYTAFEANGKLYHFCRVPFGVTNGVSCFQRTIDRIVEEDNLKGTYPYLDNVTIGGLTKEEHDVNVDKFLQSCNRRSLTLNQSKTVVCAQAINILGYCVSYGVIQPDPERLRPLQELPPPSDTKSLRRTLGMFAYYAKWIHKFSDKAKPLAETVNFPLSPNALQTFNALKEELKNAALSAIDESKPFTVECDA